MSVTKEVVEQNQIASLLERWAALGPLLSRLDQPSKRQEFYARLYGEYRTAMHYARRLSPQALAQYAAQLQFQAGRVIRCDAVAGVVELIVGTHLEALARPTPAARAAYAEAGALIDNARALCKGPA